MSSQTKAPTLIGWVLLSLKHMRSDLRRGKWEFRNSKPIARWYAVRTALVKQGIQVEPRDPANPDHMIIIVPPGVAATATKRQLDYMCTMVGSRLGSGATIIIEDQLGDELARHTVY
jgi:hypothetical protein